MFVARFLPCSACERHVRAEATQCPFCGFGPLRCTADAPTRWVLVASLAAGLSASAACTGAKEPTAPKDSAAVADDAGENEGGKEDGGATTKAEPDPVPGPEVDIYGGPRMMEGEDDVGEIREDPTPGEAQKTIYGGPRMMEGGPQGPEADTIEPEAAPVDERETPKKIYGGPRRPDGGPESPE